MLFQVLCGFEPIFYTTHPNEESINKDGTLKANEELVKKADADTLNSLFGNDNDFTSSLYRVSRQMSSSSYDDYYTSLRAGSNINLTV